jgi:L,D-transpeptidase ErfK/SrfK
MKQQSFSHSEEVPVRPFGTLAIVLICLLCSVCVAFGSSISTRQIVVNNLEKLRLTRVDQLLGEEFRSVEDLLMKADELWESGDQEDSERLYRLAHVKTDLLEKHLWEEKDKIDAEKTGDPAKEGRGEKAVVPQREEINKEPEAEKGQPSPAIEGGEKEEAGKDLTVPVNDASAGAKKVDKVRAPDDFKMPEMVIGRDFTYVVRKQETLKTVGWKTGVNWRVIATDNGLDPKKLLQPGQKLQISTKRIVPKTLADGILINIPERTLYLFKDGKLLRTYPVGLGMAKKDKIFTWHTPTGKFKITSKAKDPTWYVPPLLKKKMKSQGKDVPTVVPPGPGNPLGKFALCTSIGGILIHSTISPQSISKFSSHGCVRMLPSDMKSFFNTVHVNTSGEIIYQPVKVAVSDKGRVFLEVHGDAYKMVPDLESKTKKLLEEKNAADRVDWKKVKSLLRSGNGKVEDITL